MLVETEAIILGARRYRESSQLVVLYTQDFGKCSVVAPQSRRRKRGLSSALQPMRCSWVTFYKKPNRTLYTLARAEPILPFRRLLESYDRMSAGLAIVEAIYRTQPIEEPNAPLYHQLKAALQTVDLLETNFFAVYCWMLLQLSKRTGFAFDLFFDTTIQRPIANPFPHASILFSIDRGCPLSPGSLPTAVVVRLAREAFTFLQRCDQTPLSQLDRIPPLSDPQLQNQVLHLFRRFYHYHLGVEILSEVSFQMLQRSATAASASS